MAHSECTISVYIESKNTLLDKIKAIEALIDAMILKMAEAIGGLNPTIDEYSFDTGQMKVRTSYRSITDIEAGIHSMRKLKNVYQNEYNGRSFVLRDARGLNRY